MIWNWIWINDYQVFEQIKSISKNVEHFLKKISVDSKLFIIFHKIYFFLKVNSDSSIVFGNIFPAVSGKKYVNIPVKIIRIPMVHIGTTGEIVSD